MIRSFRDRDTEALFRREPPRRWAAIARLAQRKLRMLGRSSELFELRIPAGNRLEALRGDRDGQFSIRINAQYRICFRWHEGDASDVEITDYH